MDFMKQCGMPPGKGVRIAPGEPVVPREHVWMLMRAADIVEEAHAEARRIASAAQLAYESARSEGYLEGREAARSEHALHMVDQVAGTLNYLELIESRMIELVLTAVRRVICDAPDHERVASVVRSLLGAARNQTHLTLRLNPADALHIQPRLDALLAVHSGIQTLQIQPDTRLALGSGILESELGFVETSLEGQIDALRSAFMKVFGPGRPLLPSEPGINAAHPGAEAR